MNKLLLSKNIKKLQGIKRFSEFAGVEAETIKKLLYDKGDRNPHYLNAVKLANACGVDLSEIYKPTRLNNKP